MSSLGHQKFLTWFDEKIACRVKASRGKLADLGETDVKQPSARLQDVEVRVAAGSGSQTDSPHSANIIQGQPQFPGQSVCSTPTSPGDSFPAVFSQAPEQSQLSPLVGPSESRPIQRLQSDGASSKCSLPSFEEEPLSGGDQLHQRLGKLVVSPGAGNEAPFTDLAGIPQAGQPAAAVDQTVVTPVAGASAGAPTDTQEKKVKKKKKRGLKSDFTRDIQKLHKM